MEFFRNASARTALRFAIVSGTGLGIGAFLFKSAIFIPTLSSFQFTISSVTAGLAYAGLKSGSRRNALAALLVWCILLTSLAGPFHYWLLVLSVAYVSAIGFAIYLYLRTASKPFARGVVRRIALAGIYVALMNGMVVFVLQLIRLTPSLSYPAIALHHPFDGVLLNLQYGAWIGTAVGFGIESVEYVISRLIKYPEAQDQTIQAV